MYRGKIDSNLDSDENGDGEMDDHLQGRRETHTHLKAGPSLDESLQDPLQAFVGSAPSSRLPRQCSEGVQASSPTTRTPTTVLYSRQTEIPPHTDFIGISAA